LCARECRMERAPRSSEATDRVCWVWRCTWATCTPPAPTARSVSGASRYVSLLLQPPLFAPGFATSAPGLATSAPGLGTSAPGFGPSAPGLGTSAPGFGPSAPELATSAPGLATSAPGLATSAPGFGQHQRQGSPCAPGVGCTPALPRGWTPRAVVPRAGWAVLSRIVRPRRRCAACPLTPAPSLHAPSRVCLGF
jgi:hypothetical protein